VSISTGSGASRTRTGDLLGAIQALSQLSYSPAYGGKYVQPVAATGGDRRGGQGYAVARVSFGRRLALFLVLIAVVPTLALIGILLFVSEDSQRGKADARLASGVRTATAVYSSQTEAAASKAHSLAASPDLAAALRAHDRAAEQAFVQRAADQQPSGRVVLSDNGGNEIAAAGPPDSVAFSPVGLTEAGQPVGTLLASVTTADQYTSQVKSLTDLDAVVTRGAQTLGGTVPPPSEKLQSDQTADLSTGGKEYRGHALTLNPSDQEGLLLLGPPKGGGVLGVGKGALAVMIWFLVAAVILAWGLARTLTRRHERIAQEALTDPLTGLWNRRHMAETLDREVSRALRFGHEVSLIILDVDDFKRINDRLGHLQGDLVLETVADLVRDATRDIDVAVRYGGDELALILVETEGEGATILAERLRERVRDTEVPLRDGGTMGVTISVGVATIPDSAEDLESLVDGADRALLRAKRAGKNQIRTAPASRRSVHGGRVHRRPEGRPATEP
jgi:diguanylate cyclase (GGDEF)-like protein